MTRERHTVPLHPCARCGFAFSSEDRGRTRGELRKRLPLAHPRLCRLLGVCMCIAAIRSLPCTRDVRGRVPVRLGEQGVVDRGIRCGFARTETLEEVAKGRVVREGAHRHHRVEGSELPVTLPRRHMRPAGPGNIGGSLHSKPFILCLNKVFGRYSAVTETILSCLPNFSRIRTAVLK